MKARPAIVLTPQAVEDWRRLRRQGLAHGHAQPKLSRLMPEPGTPRHRMHVTANGRGGIIRDPNRRWVATFVKERAPGKPTVWLVDAIKPREVRR